MWSDWGVMIQNRHVLTCLVAAMSVSAFASPRDVKAAPSVCPLVAPAEAKAEMVRYSLQAYGSGDPTNGLQALSPPRADSTVDDISLIPKLYKIVNF